MKLANFFQRNKSVTNSESIDPAAINLPPAPEAVPEYSPPQTTSSRSFSGMTAWIVSIVSLLILLTGLFFAGRWVFHYVHKPSPVATTTQTVPVTILPNTKSTTPIAPPVSSTPSPSVPAQTSPTPTTSSPSASASTTTPLVNTGPGSTLAIFLTTSALGTAVYQLMLHRRQRLSRDS